MDEIHHPSKLGVGIDLVRISGIRESIGSFGEQFLQRIYTADEIAYACSAPDSTAERLAARFAAKEATKKALRLDGVGWRDIEVRRAPDGACDLLLHGHARDTAAGRTLALSMSHDGDFATAIVITI
jgi:holo-[acyl-carrier protein] synthase